MPVEVPVEVCLLLPVLRFEVLLITKTTWETLHSEKQGTHPEPQTHKHRSETYDLIWREGHVQGHTQICRCCRRRCTALPSHAVLPCSWCATVSFTSGHEIIYIQKPAVYLNFEKYFQLHSVWHDVDRCVSRKTVWFQLWMPNSGFHLSSLSAECLRYSVSFLCVLTKNLLVFLLPHLVPKGSLYLLTVLV